MSGDAEARPTDDKDKPDDKGKPDDKVTAGDKGKAKPTQASGDSGTPAAGAATTPATEGTGTGKDARKVATVEGLGAERKARDAMASLFDGFSPSQWNTAIFTGTVDARDAVFGTSAESGQGQAGWRARTGRLPEDEARALCERFAEPPHLKEAAQSLDQDHVVVLAGAAGLGKRTSAVRLLLDAGAKQLEVVSPALTLDELAKVDFDAGHGYLIEDWQQAARAASAGDFSWRVLREHVKDAEAYLVITAGRGKAGGPVGHIAWQAPTTAQVLAAYLRGEDADTLIAEVCAHVPDTYGVGDVASVGQRLAGGHDRAKILEELSDDPGRFVSEWLSADTRTDDEIQRVVALGFAAGRSVRVFEVMLMRLERTLIEGGMLPDPKKARQQKKDDDDTAGGYVPRPVGLRAARRRQADGLLVRDDGKVRFTGDPARQRLYHEHALRELWHAYDMSFWGLARKWLADLIGDTTIRDVQVSVAVGLTMLASVAVDEVEDAYLHPWASGEREWSGQHTAVYVLWQMSRDSALAPVALRIATDLVNCGNASCQWTAAAALSGELGAVYPGPATSRLWHLVGQWQDVPTEAVIALSILFATLTSDGDGREAHRVLELLRDRLNRASGRDTATEDTAEGGPRKSWRDDRKNRERALLCILHVLAVRARGTKQPAITSFLVARPDQLDLVAELWAAALRYRPCRKRALEALLAAVRGFEYARDDPEAAARELGDALADALPPNEHQPLTLEFNNILARSKRPEGSTAAAVRALVAALEHLKPAERAAR